VVLTQPATDAASIEAERLHRKRQVALGYRIFASLRWGDLGDGHITARDPELTDHLWLLRYPVGFEAATVDDLVLVRPDGSVVGDATINETAYHIHHPIHEARPDRVAVAHTHTAWGTPFCATGRPITPITQEACNFFDDWAYFDDEEVQVLGTAGGQRIAEALGAKRAVLLRCHGLLTTGASVADSVAAFVLLERVCEEPGSNSWSSATSATHRSWARRDERTDQPGEVTSPFAAGPAAGPTAPVRGSMQNT